MPQAYRGIQCINAGRSVTYLWAVVICSDQQRESMDRNSDANFGEHVHWNVWHEYASLTVIVQGGTFLYVATVLQPGKAASEELGEKVRMVLVVCGIFIPVLIGVFVGHEH